MQPLLRAGALLVVFLLLRQARAQIAQARVHAGELVEIAVAAFLRQLQLLDRRRQTALQHVGLGLGLVRQQSLALGLVALRPQLIQPRLVRKTPDLLVQQRVRFAILPEPLQRLDAGIVERAVVGIAHQRLLQHDERALVVAAGSA